METTQSNIPYKEHTNFSEIQFLIILLHVLQFCHGLHNCNVKALNLFLYLNCFYWKRKKGIFKRFIFKECKSLLFLIDFELVFFGLSKLLESEVAFLLQQCLQLSLYPKYYSKCVRITRYI